MTSIFLRSELARTDDQEVNRTCQACLRTVMNIIYSVLSFRSVACAFMPEIQQHNMVDINLKQVSSACVVPRSLYRDLSFNQLTTLPAAGMFGSENELIHM